MNKTEIKKYCKRSIIVEAAQFDGTVESLNMISEWSGATLFTSDGGVKINPGDWMIRGIQGEFYRCEAEIFKRTYGTPQNKLISDDFRKEMLNIYHGFDEARRTGRSYGQALAIIGSAMQRPGTPVFIHDHSGNQNGDKVLTSKVFAIIEKLQLKNFKMERDGARKFCLIYEIFEVKKDK